MESKESFEERLKVAQLQKLQLENRNLERGRNLGSTIAPYIPIITACIAVAGFSFGLYQYHHQEVKQQEAAIAQSKRENDLREAEFKKRFWERQLEEYSAITQSAARLATWDRGAERDKEYLHFRELYHGNLIMLADKSVVEATKEFLQLYIDYRDDPTIQGQVDKSSRKLAIACRESLRQTWNVPLQQLDLATIP